MFENIKSQATRHKNVLKEVLCVISVNAFAVESTKRALHLHALKHTTGLNTMLHTYALEIEHSTKYFAH